MAVFSRYVSTQLIRPITDLAKNADAIRETGNADIVPVMDRRTGGANEVSALYQSFFDMVETLDSALVKAEQAERIKADFLSVVSHELRTPMTSVLGFTKMNRKRLLDQIYPRLDKGDPVVAKVVSQIEGNFDIVVSEGNRLTALINDVLDLAKLESGAYELDMVPVDVEELLTQSLAACAGLFMDKPLDYRLDVDDDVHRMFGDYDKLMQVVINFLSNAVKFTEQGEIILTARNEGGMVIASVEDTGIGIPVEEQPLVFQRFHQRRETLTDKPQGTGLGLPICKHIVEAHGGRIWLESEPGRGSRFTFSIPAVGEA